MITSSVGFAQEEFTISEPWEKYGVKNVNLKGKFDDTSYDKIQQMVKQYENEILVVHANSTGGYANDVIKTMDTIHAHGNIIWVVDENNVCASMCANVGMASSRVIGKMYFHGIKFENGERDELTNIKVVKRFVNYGYPESKIKNTMGFILQPITFRNGNIL